MTDAKVCPSCGAPLDLYDVPSGLTVGRFFASEGAYWLVVLLLAPILFGLGVSNPGIAMALAIPVVLLLLWRIWGRWGREAKAEHARYYCQRCNHHFEGDALRQLTR